MLADSHPIIEATNDRLKFSLFILIGSFLRQLNRTFNIGLTFFP